MKLWSGVSSQALGHHPDRVDLLFAALQFNQDLEALAKLRMTLMTDPVALQSLVVTADRRMLLAALLARLEDKQMLGMPAGQADPLLCQLAIARKRFTERRQVLMTGLCEIARALNERDIVPMLLKGSGGAAPGGQRITSSSSISSRHSSWTVIFCRVTQRRTKFWGGGRLG